VNTHTNLDEFLSLAAACKALSHPARLAILQTLAQRGVCICGEIVDVLPQSQATVSQHLKELKDSGLIQGDIEPPKVRYCIHPETWNYAKTLFTSFFESKNI